MNNGKLQNGITYFVKILFIIEVFFLFNSSYAYTLLAANQNNMMSARPLSDVYPDYCHRCVLVDPMLADASGSNGCNNNLCLDPDPSGDAVTYGSSASSDIKEACTSDFVDRAPLPPPPCDPLETLNRSMFVFNDKIDAFILKPIALLYNKIMPRPLNRGIHNVFFNINTLPTIANDVLQANFYQAANDIWRVGINTTLGIGGLFDVAQRIKLEPYSNDFGLTMARWGYTSSSYLVLPFFGPNTLRDALGIPVDYFAFSLYPHITPPSTRYQVYALSVIDKRAQLLKFQEVMEEAALDKYVFVRSAYMQRRAHQMEENKHRSYCDRLAVSGSTGTSSTLDKIYD